MRRVWAMVAIVMAVAGCEPPSNGEISRPAPSPPASNPPKQTAQRAGNPDRVYQLSDLRTVPIRVGKRTIRAWVMDTPGKRTEGMMFLRAGEVREDQGMIFVFPDVRPNDGQNGFWMKNTVLPLDIVYIGPTGRVVNVARGKPFDLTSLPPAGPYRYVLELKAGMAARLGIRPGVRIGIPSELKASE